MSGTYNGINKATGTAFTVPYSHVWRVDTHGQPVEVRVFTSAAAFAHAVQPA